MQQINDNFDIILVGYPQLQSLMDKLLQSVLESIFPDGNNFVIFRKTKNLIMCLFTCY